MVPDDERQKYLTPEFLKAAAPFDPLKYLPSLGDRSVRLQQTMTEPLTPNAAKTAIAAALAPSATRVQYKGPEDLLKAWKVSGLSSWIKHQIRPQTADGSPNSQPSAATSAPPDKTAP